MKPIYIQCSNVASVLLQLRKHGFNSFDYDSLYNKLRHEFEDTSSVGCTLLLDSHFVKVSRNFDKFHLLITIC